MLPACKRFVGFQPEVAPGASPSVASPPPSRSAEARLSVIARTSLSPGLFPRQLISHHRTGTQCEDRAGKTGPISLDRVAPNSPSAPVQFQSTPSIFHSLPTHPNKSLRRRNLHIKARDKVIRHILHPGDRNQIEQPRPHLQRITKARKCPHLDSHPPIRHRIKSRCGTETQHSKQIRSIQRIRHIRNLFSIRRSVSVRIDRRVIHQRIQLWIRTIHTFQNIGNGISVSAFQTQIRKWNRLHRPQIRQWPGRPEIPKLIRRRGIPQQHPSFNRWTPRKRRHRPGGSTELPQRSQLRVGLAPHHSNEWRQKWKCRLNRGVVPNDISSPGRYRPYFIMNIRTHIRKILSDYTITQLQ